jgi:hypothetical protein
VRRSQAILDSRLTALTERVVKAAADARPLAPDVYLSDERFAPRHERIFSRLHLHFGASVAPETRA